MAPLPMSVGANVRVADLPVLIDWLIEGQRDLELWEGQDPDVLDSGWKSLFHRVHPLLDGYNGKLGIHGPWDGLPLLNKDRRVRALVVLRLMQALEFGRTKVTMFSTARLNFLVSMVAHTPSQGLEEEIDLVHQTLDEVLPFARQINCELVLEVNYDTRSTPLLSLIESFDDKQVRLSLDTGHAYIMQRLGGPPPDQWIRDAGPLLTHLHLEDTDGLFDRHWAPGEGNINWYAVFRFRERSPPSSAGNSAAKVRAAAGWLKFRVGCCWSWWCVIGYANKTIFKSTIRE
jgi:sugar phosphate isomerase/epimerase